MTDTESRCFACGQTFKLTDGHGVCPCGGTAVKTGPAFPVQEPSPMSYERFTDRARMTMQLANNAAISMHHEYIGTEHILFALSQQDGIAADVLLYCTGNAQSVREAFERVVQRGPEMVVMSRLPQTPRAKNVVQYAMEEARKLNHNYVGTEHLLLGLLRDAEADGEGTVAAKILKELDLPPEGVRSEVLRRLKSRSVGETAQIARESLQAKVGRMNARTYFTHLREFAQHLLKIADQHPDAKLGFTGENGKSMSLSGRYPCVSFRTTPDGQIEDEPVVIIDLY